MNRVRVLVAEDNPLQREWLSEYLGGQPQIEVVGAAADGVEALGMVLQLRPRVLVLDMVMPRLDGYGLLERLQQLPGIQRPAVIAMTSLGRDDFIVRAINMSVNYYLVKPVDGEYLVRRILDAAGETEALPMILPPPPAPPRQLVTEMLMQLGVPAHLTGYKYLRSALLRVLEEPEVLAGLSRTLYPAVAEEYGATVCCVERGIRHAIAQAWNRGGERVYRQLLGRSASTVGDRPTNGEFLAQVSEGLRMQLRRPRRSIQNVPDALL